MPTPTRARSGASLRAIRSSGSPDRRRRRLHLGDDERADVLARGEGAEQVLVEGLLVLAAKLGQRGIQDEEGLRSGEQRRGERGLLVGVVEADRVRDQYR